MDSCALELDGLLLPNSHTVHGRNRESEVALARELRFGNWAVVDLVNAVWHR
jgi:hypothetical protein